MAKHAVPKRKQSKARSKKRYASYKTKAQKRLLNLANGHKHRTRKAETLRTQKETALTKKVTKIQA